MRVMVRRLATLVVTIVSMFLLGPGVLARSAPSISPLGYLADPGPRPTLDPRDYDAYRHSGTASIYGKLELPIPADSCRGHMVLLYPNTAYSRWMLTTWFRRLDGESLTSYSVPTARHAEFTVPSYLDALGELYPNRFGFEEQRTNAIQFGRCIPHRTVAFENVPAGNYIFVVSVGREVPIMIHNYGMTMNETPEGLQPMETSESHMSTHQTDGYIMSSVGELVVEAGQHYTINAKNVVPVARFRL